MNNEPIRACITPGSFLYLYANQGRKPDLVPVQQGPVELTFSCGAATVVLRDDGTWAVLTPVAL